MKASCPSRPKQHAFSAVSQTFHTSRSVKVPVSITFSDEEINTVALIVSGAAGNFIDADFAKSYGLPLTPCKSPLTVAALDGRPLGACRVQSTACDLHLTTGALHTGIICFFIIQAPNNSVILGLHWLQLHDHRFYGLRVRSLTAQTNVQHNYFRLSNLCRTLLKQQKFPLSIMTWLRLLARQRLPKYPRTDPATVPLSCCPEPHHPRAEFFPFLNLKLNP